MGTLARPRPAPCTNPCTTTLKFLTDHAVPPNVGISVPPYKKTDGYRHVNVFVEFDQADANEAPVDLGVVFAFDQSGAMGARRYANLEENLSGPQSTHFIEVSGGNSWHGSPHNVSRYIARFPVMGPYLQVFVYNRAPRERKVNVWAYLVA